MNERYCLDDDGHECEALMRDISECTLWPLDNFFPAGSKLRVEEGRCLRHPLCKKAETLYRHKSNHYAFTANGFYCGH